MILCFDYHAMPSPAVADVVRITAMDNPVLRNLEITECYADLSAAMRVRTGGAADWCTFATWASRQAGCTIRGEDLLDIFNRHLGRRAWLLAPLSSCSRLLLRRGMFQPNTALGRAMQEVHTPFDAFERASMEVARGNLKVFAEIGREFAKFLVTVPVDAREDSPEFLAFAETLDPGPPPDGQTYLREAFAHYQQQRRETDPGVRASWILLANLKIGLHEQTRLQPEIVGSVDAPLTTFADLGARVLHALVPGSRNWPQLLHGPAVTVAGWIARRLRREAETITRDVITESMMSLALPDVVLALGRNLDAPVPPALSGVPQAFLESFVKEYDPCPPGATTCAARDWCSLPQRMHYIVHLFRAYSEDQSLSSRPFTANQVASFRAGKMPTGDL
jgi:hypothetical protein